MFDMRAAMFDMGAAVFDMGAAVFDVATAMFDVGAHTRRHRLDPNTCSVPNTAPGAA